MVTIVIIIGGVWFIATAINILMDIFGSIGPGGH